MREYLLVLTAFIGQSDLLWSLTNANVELSTAKFVVHRAPTIADFYPLTESRTLVEHLDMSKNTVLYLHGFIENLKSKSIHVIAEAYLSRNDTNLIVLDWAELADGDYALDAVVNAKKLGPYLGTVLLEMFDYGLDIEKLHVVGHSLGAHVASMVGREILKQTHGAKILKRITGLDPALALFYLPAGLNKHLTKDDAVFVDVIHTDAWLYGTPVNTGTVDFWPNGGTTLQPGCPTRDHILLSENDLCSHKRSWLYWAESVIDRVPSKFNAVAAKSWFHFKIGRTEPDQGVVMGHNCPTNVHGSYYLQTNGETPLARGKMGLRYTH